jgi:hypothetical protein
VLGALGQLASDSCNVSIALGADGTVSSIQPVP